ncbi:MAG TPA: hypothetical protein IAA61_06610 [Candidatus Ornithomonoglobus merdipullorum]|uniref:Uncharacterized protein n=1 Tax=Candidatus Ornithomonoglobus merdipullorum TaxID=2840895 RepID=A0A9D1MCA6_9FIRM|nr:hypothetical protein [Candidatus Ornithomonoglobus merdipullorum]
MKKLRSIKHVSIAAIALAALISSAPITASAKWYTGNSGFYYQINIPDNLTKAAVNGNCTILSNASGTNTLTIENQYDDWTWENRGYYGYVEDLISFVERNGGYITGVTTESYGRYKVTWCLWGQDHAGYWLGANGGCLYFDYAYPNYEDHGSEIMTMWNTFALLGNTP